jgi:hypothetical protein
MILFNFMDLTLALRVELFKMKLTIGGDDNDEDDREDIPILLSVS